MKEFRNCLEDLEISQEEVRNKKRVKKTLRLTLIT